MLAIRGKQGTCAYDIRNFNGVVLTRIIQAESNKEPPIDV